MAIELCVELSSLQQYNEEDYQHKCDVKADHKDAESGEGQLEEVEVVKHQHGGYHAVHEEEGGAVNK